MKDVIVFQRMKGTNSRTEKRRMLIRKNLLHIMDIILIIINRCIGAHRRPMFVVQYR